MADSSTTSRLREVNLGERWHITEPSEAAKKSRGGRLRLQGPEHSTLWLTSAVDPTVVVAFTEPEVLIELKGDNVAFSLVTQWTVPNTPFRSKLSETLLDSWGPQEDSLVKIADDVYLYDTSAGLRDYMGAGYEAIHRSLQVSTPKWLQETLAKRGVDCKVWHKSNVSTNPSAVEGVSRLFAATLPDGWELNNAEDPHNHANGWRAVTAPTRPHLSVTTDGGRTTDVDPEMLVNVIGGRLILSPSVSRLEIFTPVSSKASRISSNMTNQLTKQWRTITKGLEEQEWTTEAETEPVPDPKADLGSIIQARYERYATHILSEAARKMQEECQRSGFRVFTVTASMRSKEDEARGSQAEAEASQQ